MFGFLCVCIYIYYMYYVSLVFVALMCLAPNPTLPINRQLPMLQTATNTTLSIFWSDNSRTQSFCESENRPGEHFSLAPYVFSVNHEANGVDGMVQVSVLSVTINYTLPYKNL